MSDYPDFPGNADEVRYFIGEKVTIDKYAHDFEQVFHQPRPFQLDALTGATGTITEVIPGKIFVNIEGLKELDCYKVVFDKPIENPNIGGEPIGKVICQKTIVEQRML